MDSKFIIITEYCHKSDIEPAFIDLLDEIGLIEISRINDEKYVKLSQLHLLEKYARMYYDLSINMEGIDVISRLLDKMNTMRQEIVELKNQVRFYMD